MELWLPYFYETIMERLLLIQDEKEQPLLKHFDLWYGQYDIETNANEDEGIDAYNKPAIFFETSDYEYQSLGMKRKVINDFEFRLHLQTEVEEEVAKREPKSIRDRQHEHFKLQAEVERLLQGFNGNMVTENFNGFGSIFCLGSSPYIYRGMSIIHIARFKTRIVIDANTTQLVHAAPPLIPALPTDDITTDILP